MFFNAMPVALARNVKMLVTPACAKYISYSQMTTCYRTCKPSVSHRSCCGVAAEATLHSILINR